jgi:hypothetical protein
LFKEDDDKKDDRMLGLKYAGDIAMVFLLGLESLQNIHIVELDAEALCP